MSVETGSGKSFFVNGFDINTIPKFEVDQVLVGDMGVPGYSTQQSVRGDGAKTTYGSVGIRSIHVTGHILATDWYDYLAVRAKVLRYLMVGLTGRALNSELKHYIDSANTIERVYYGNVKNPAITFIESGKATLDVEFQCEDPFGYDTATTGFNQTTTGVTKTQIGVSDKYTVKAHKSKTLSLQYKTTLG